MSDKTLVNTRVRCINRITKGYFDRDFHVDLSTLQEADRVQVERLTNQRIHAAEFLKVRPLFLVDQGLCPENMSQFDRITGFYVEDYFEDEAGNPLDQINLAQIRSGQEDPILLYDVRSVLRLGPTGILRKELWDTDAANTLAHFFQLVEVVGSSNWLRSKLSITSSGSINFFECPDLGQMYTILLPIRQLYSEDDAFNKACTLYLRHVQDERKQWWVKTTKKEFNAYLASVPTPYNIERYSVEHLLNVVMYGAGLVHYGKTDRQTRQDFKDAVTRHRREWVIFTFIWYCQQLYAYANRVYFVLRQDYDHWVSTEGCQSPDLVFMRSLFSSHRLLPAEGPDA